MTHAMAPLAWETDSMDRETKALTWETGFVSWETDRISRETESVASKTGADAQETDRISWETESVLWETALISREAETVARGTDLKPPGRRPSEPTSIDGRRTSPGGKAYAAARVTEKDGVVNTLGHGVRGACHEVRGVLRANRVASHIAAEAAKTSAGLRARSAGPFWRWGIAPPAVGDAPLAVPMRADPRGEGAKSDQGVAADIRAAEIV